MAISPLWPKPPWWRPQQGLCHPGHRWVWHTRPRFILPMWEHVSAGAAQRYVRLAQTRRADHRGGVLIGPATGFADAGSCSHSVIPVVTDEGAQSALSDPREISMTLVDRASIGRYGIAALAAAVFGALVAAMLMVPVAGVSAQSPPPTSIAAFLLDRGRYTTIEAPEPGVELAPIGINNRGQIAGYTAVDLVQTELHGFLLAEGVEGDFTPIDFPGAGPNGGLRYQRSRPDHRRLREPRCRAG
jgi:hypothetical protein